MSTTDIETPQGRESGLFHRTFQAEITGGDGRTIDVRLVPYGERATVDDGHGPYEEEFEEGAFDGQLNVAHRVLLNFEHERGIGGIVGRGESLRSVPGDGLYGSFRALEHSDSDKALALVREGVLTGVSIEFLAKKTIRTAEGVVKRVKAHLDGAALCRRPAYASAAVLGVRHAPILDEELLLPDLDTQLVERLRAAGVALPDRYTRHPEPETDTSAETDTSEDDGTPLIDFT